MVISLAKESDIRLRMSSLVFRADADPLFRSYYAIQPIVSAVASIASREAPALVTYYSHAITEILEGERAASKPNQMFEDNDPRLMLRRLSRESITLAHNVDGCARFLHAAQRECSSLRGPWRIETHGLNYFDRPSLRVIARLGALARGPSNRAIQLISEAEEKLSEAAGTAAASDAEAPDVIRTSRKAILREIGRLWNLTFDFHSDSLCGRVGNASSAEPNRAAWIEALRLQNYERAYAILCFVLSEAVTANERVPATIVISMMLANLGDADTPIKLLNEASCVAKASSNYASLQYLLGLIKTKKTANLDEAEQHFRNGLEAIDAAPSLEESEVLERGWLLNGLALLRALRAKAEKNAASASKLLSILEGQADIVALSRLYDTEEFRYLHFNVLANTTLLLEGMGRHSDAFDFWRRAFEDSYQLNSLSKERANRGIFYFYRTGMLALRSENGPDALISLRQALECSDSPKTYLLKSHVLYALGYAFEKHLEHISAANCFSQGAELAREAFDRSQSLLHTRALMRMSVELAVAVPAAQVAASGHESYFQESCHPDTHLESGGLLPPPSKLPSYLPFIDLDPLPDRNLNKILSD
jgi:tetratricopeptide (TPR) repeat protein